MSKYVIAADRSRLAVAVHGLLRTRGEFARVAGSASTDEHGRFESLEVTIDARSLDTRLLPRDLHLKTASFLDARRYPLITYRSQRIEQVGADRYTIQGVLRLHGREHPVMLAATLTQASASDDTYQAHVTGAIPREPFGIPRNPLLDALVRPLIGDEVLVTADVHITLVLPAPTPLSASQARA